MSSQAINTLHLKSVLVVRPQLFNDSDTDVLPDVHPFTRSA